MTLRSIDTRFWKDNWARSVNPLDRYLFLYLLTNSATSWCGVYELPVDVIAFETGIDREELKMSMLPRLSPKVIYFEGWVYVPNWLKYHMSESGNLSPQQKKGFDKAWESVPERIRLKIKEIEGNGIPYAYPMGGVSASASAFTSSSSSAYAIVSEREKPQKSERTTLTGSETFWGLYPKKVNKQQFLAEWRKLSSEDRATAIADVPQRLNSEQWRETKFIPMPSNFIRDRRWEDEIIHFKSNVFHIK